MTNYNVWDIAQNHWRKNISVLNMPDQDIVCPYKLSYVHARTVLEHYKSLGTNSEVRLLNDDNSSGLCVGYNIWIPSRNRWTNASGKSVGWKSWYNKYDKSLGIGDLPQPLSFQQAQKLAHLINMSEAVIMEINADLSPQALTIDKMLAEMKCNKADNVVVGRNGQDDSNTTISSDTTTLAVPFDFDAYNGFTRGR